MLDFLRAFLDEVGDTREVVKLFLDAAWLADGPLELLKGRRILFLGIGDSEELGWR